MYELYLENCTKKFNDNYQPVSASVYRQIFNEEFNLGFYKPKKDQCGECSKYDLMTSTEKEGHRVELEEHLARNEEAQRAKATDKQRACENASFRSVTFFAVSPSSTVVRCIPHVRQAKVVLLQLHSI